MDTSVFPISGQVNVEYSKKRIEQCITVNKFKPEEAGILELTTSWRKNIKKAIVCDGNGTFRIRDLRRLKDRIEEYDDLLKNKKITQEDHDALKKKAVKDELNSDIC